MFEVDPATRTQFYDAVFTSSDSQELYRKLAVLERFNAGFASLQGDLSFYLNSGGNILNEEQLHKDLQNLLIDPGTKGLYKEVQERVDALNGRRPFPFSIGFLFSQVSLGAMEQVQEDPGAIRRRSSNFYILPTHKAYTNCGSSEFLLRNAMREGEVTDVYGGLLLKDKGQNVGFCYQAVTSGSQTFIPGFWYGPCGRLRNKIKGAIDRKTPRSNPTGVWVITRACSDERILDEVRSYVAQRA